MEYPEIRAFRQFRQVIVWGYPLHSHTHSYIHGAWVKAFQSLNIPVRWFHDKEFPKEADYTNTCFLTEGWADEKIPLHPSNTYFVHIATNPQKYTAIGARLIEIRYNVLEIHDYNYDYVLPPNGFPISDQTLYEIAKDDSAVAPKRGRPVQQVEYEVAYMYWATDLLPQEIKQEDATLPRQRVIHYIGSDCKNPKVREFQEIAERAGIQWVSHDPWQTPLSYEDTMRLMKLSYCAPDFRTNGQEEKRKQYGEWNGTNHLKIGYVPCRVFKAISYGQTGITNSPRVKQILGDFVEYAERPEDVLPLVNKRTYDHEWRTKCMTHVANTHTYVQRIRDLARILRMPKPQRFQTPLGTFYVLPNDEAFYACLSKGVAWEASLLSNLLPHIPNRGTILDVGGHIGTHAIPYSVQKPNAQIYSFEPQKHMRFLLQTNKEANKATNLTIFPYGLGHMNTTKRLAFDFTSDGYRKDLTLDYTSPQPQNFGGIGITNDPRGEEIQIRSLDTLHISDVSFMKIDVEGAEKLVVYGAQDTIQLYKPTLLIEQSDKDVSPLYTDECPDLKEFSIQEFLQSLGYQRQPMGDANYLYRQIT